MPMGFQLLLSPDFIAKVIREVHVYIRGAVTHDRSSAFKAVTLPGKSGKPKECVKVDLLAEQFFVIALRKRFPEESLCIFGEESLPDPNADLRRESRVCVLADILDGTDLLELTDGGWCSAITVFHPAKRKILAAYVALPSRLSQPGTLYYARHDRVGAFKRPLGKHGVTMGQRISSPDPSMRLRDARMCAYTQKLKNWNEFRNVADGLMKWAVGDASLKFRFYNFAGNPMLARLADGDIHVVVEPTGQAPHDMVPGAFVAGKAGCQIRTLDNRLLTESMLVDSLLRPAHSDSRLKYVAGSNKKVLRDLFSVL